MEEQPEPVVAPRSKIWKLVVYFVALWVFGQLMGLAFAALQGSTAVQGFAKLNQIIGDSLDMTRNRDDVIVTIWSLVLTMILVIPVGWTYTYTKAKEGYDRTLVQTLIVMGMVVCGMMMLIQDQFSRALALVGVVSAVRFRTNLRDPKDAVYMLVAIGVGMGAGLHVYRVAAWLTIIMCLVFIGLSKVKFGEQPERDEIADADKKKDKKKDKKDKKDKKKEKAGEGEEGAVVVASATADDRLERIADSLRDPERGVRRPNTAILLDAVDAEAAINYVTNALARYQADWHLVTFAPTGEVTRLEYMVWLDPKEDALAAVARDVEGSCGTTVRTIEVRFVPGGTEAAAVAGT